MAFFSRKSRKSRKSGDHGYLISRETPAAVKKAFKELETNLIFSLSGSACKKILLTSTTANERKSTAAINLAKVLAEDGYRVLLLDGDLRSSAMAGVLHLKEEPGLTNVLVCLARAEDAVQPYIENLDVITAGVVAPNPSELLGSEDMETLLSQLEGQYDYIIVDSPPVKAGTDAVVLARYMTGVIIVVRSGTARKDALATCLDDMRACDAKILGFIVASEMEGKR